MPRRCPLALYCWAAVHGSVGVVVDASQKYLVCLIVASVCLVTLHFFSGTPGMVGGAGIDLVIGERVRYK
jgi:hypothetical protein